VGALTGIHAQIVGHEQLLQVLAVARAEDAAAGRRERLASSNVSRPVFRSRWPMMCRIDLTVSTPMRMGSPANPRPYNVRVASQPMSA
jgi:hypothetical protein